MINRREDPERTTAFKIEELDGVYTHLPTNKFLANALKRFYIETAEDAKTCSVPLVLEKDNFLIKFRETSETFEGGQKTLVLRPIWRPKVKALLIFCDKNRRHSPKMLSL